MTLWYEWSFDNQEADGEVKAHIRVPADSPWFDGHFPDAPVLPGVAQLGMVHDLLCRIIQSRVAGQAGQQGALQADDPSRSGPDPDGKGRRGRRQPQLPHRRRSGVDLQRPDPAGNRETRRPMNMAVETDKIILRIAEIMINELKLEDVTPETFDADIDLVDEVGIDSMDLATVALVLRDEYAVRIDEDDYPKLTTVRLIGEYIRKKLAA